MSQSKRFPCIVCKRGVRDTEEAIACDKCSRWQHRTCGGLEELVTPCHYRLLCSGTLQFTWLCDGCDKRRRRHIAETTSPPKVPPTLEFELPQAEIPEEDLTDEDEKPRVVGCSYRVSTFNFLATYAEQSFTPDVDNDSVLGTVTELVRTKSDDADLPLLCVKDEISSDTDSKDHCDRKKHHHDEQEEELEDVLSKRRKRNNLPVATVLPMPQIEEDLSLEKPDYDDKAEEELDGSDVDDLSLVDLCSSDDDDDYDDDSPPTLELELPQVEIPRADPGDKDEKPRVVGYSYPVSSALTNLATYVEQLFTPTGDDHSALGAVAAQVPSTSSGIPHKSDDADLSLLCVKDEMFPDGDSGECDRLKRQHSIAVKGSAEKRLKVDRCDRKRHHHDEQESGTEQVSSKRHDERVATDLPMLKIEDCFSLDQRDYDEMGEEELVGSDADDVSLVDLCSSDDDYDDDDDDTSELVLVGRVINRDYDPSKLVTVGHVVNAPRPGKQN